MPLKTFTRNAFGKANIASVPSSKNCSSLHTTELFCLAAYMYCLRVTTGRREG